MTTEKTPVPKLDDGIRDVIFYAAGLVAINAAIVLLWTWKSATATQRTALALAALLGLALYLATALL